MNKIPEFGIKKENEVEVHGGCAVIFDPETDKFAIGKQKNGLLRLFSGGVNDGENIKDGILREVEEESGLYDFSHVEKISEAIVHFFNSLKNSNRTGYSACFLLILKNKNLKPTKLEEHEKFTLAWATAEEIFESWKTRNKNKDYDHWIYFLEKSLKKLKELGYDKKLILKN